MVTHEHPLSRLSDYVLDLLEPDERKRVNRHLNNCAHCRDIVQQERALGRDVRSTLLLATNPHPARLRKLGPPSPAPRARRHVELTLRPLLALVIVVLLFAGSLQLNHRNAAGVPVDATATTLAATATLTPTSTVEPDPGEPDSSRASDGAATAAQPAATPVVALLAIAQN